MGAGGEGKKFGEGISAKDGCWRRRKKNFWTRNFHEGWVLRLGVGVVKVNNFLEMGFRQRMGAGGEGKKTFWRWDCGEGWVLAVKVKKNLEMEFR